MEVDQNNDEEIEETLQDHVRHHFGFEDFLNEHQEETLNEIMESPDEMNFIINMASKGGKSLCYQLPGVLSGGVVIVLSPSVALINDQKKFLVDLGIHAEAISSYMDDNERNETKERIKDGTDSRFLFLTPEMAQRQTEYLAVLICSNVLKYVVVDEAHKIIDAGDYRDFSILGKLRFITSDLNIPWIALTSSNRVMLQQIATALNMHNPQIISSSMVRKNIFYDSVEFGTAKGKTIADFINNLGYDTTSGIIFCKTVIDIERTIRYLANHPMRSVGYHGRMTTEDRERNFNIWASGGVKILVATGESFGYGMHNYMPNVTYVIHIGMPANLRSFYHESSHAGNDGEQQGFSRIYRETFYFRTFNDTDFNKYHNAPCKRQYLAKYFDEEIKSCKNMCDTCVKRQKAFQA